MEKKIVIAEFPIDGTPSLATCLYTDGKASEFYLTKREDESVHVGDIYIGKIETIQKNIQAAFVRFSREQTGYLPLKEGMKAGDQFPVQIEKEAMKQKLPRLTTNLTLTGRYFVMTLARPTLNFSRSLSVETITRLERLLRERHDKSFGVIVRTNCEEAGEEDLLQEWDSLSARMHSLTTAAATRTLYSRLERGGEVWMELLTRSLPKDLVRVVTDVPEVFEQIQAEDPAACPSLYTDTQVALYKLYNMTTLLTESTAKKVWLKSGGFLVIEQTEAFIAIDVNTGRYVGNKNRTDTIAMTNQEAADEAARQIRLRELSGTILIDFINLEPGHSADQLCAYMQNAFVQDPAKPKVIDITKLGIMEVTRKKTRRSLLEQIRAIQESAT